jgi:hypothetical protein
MLALLVGSSYFNYISGRVIPLGKHHCSADDLSPLIGFLAWVYGSWCVHEHKWDDSVFELPVLGANRSCVFLAIISKISVRGYQLFNVA